MAPGKPADEDHHEDAEEHHQRPAQVRLEEEEAHHGEGEEGGEGVVPDPGDGPALEGLGQGEEEAELGELQGLELQGSQHEPGPGPVDLPAHHEDQGQEKEGGPVKGIGQAEEAAAGEELQEEGEEKPKPQGHALAVEEDRVGGGAPQVDKAQSDDGRDQEDEAPVVGQPVGPRGRHGLPR